MIRKLSTALGVIGMVGLSGCGLVGPDGEPSEPVDEPGQSALALSIDYKGGSDVAGFNFLVKTCAGEVVIDANKPLEDLSLPGMIPTFDHAPFDAHSSHLFSDHYMVLEKGCYDVTVRPLSREGTPSRDCSSATARGVEVHKGLTTEILLISQCQGPKRGGLDVIAAMNNAPSIKELKYNPSKFVFECEETFVCVTAHDPDGDPLEFVWERLDDDYVHAFDVLEEQHRHGNYVTQCARFVPLWYGSYDIKVTVYDLFYDQEAKKYVRAEDYMERKSSVSLSFPIHTNWDIEHECYDPVTKTFHKFDGVREIVRDPGCYPIWPSQFYCSDYYWPDTETTCPNGEFAPETVYPICDFGDD